MDFAQAVAGLRGGQAARTPRMHGYVKREDYENNSENASLFADGALEVFDVTFVPNPLVPGGAPEYRFRCAFRRGPDGVPELRVLDGSLEVDAALLSEMLSSDWAQYRLADLEEAARTASGGRW